MKNQSPAATKALLLSTIESLVLIGGVGSLFCVWFPFPYTVLAGGWLLVVIFAVAVVISGPGLMMLVFRRKKTRRELVVDLIIVILIQCAILVYGVVSISRARPVLTVFEVDRFVVVSAIQIDQTQLNRAPPEFRKVLDFNLTGPTWASTRDPVDNSEMLASIEQSLQGLEPSLRPNWWHGYDEDRDKIKRAMKPALKLSHELSASDRAKLEEAIKKYKLKPEDIFYLPLASRKNLDNWVVLLNSDADPVGFASVGGFQA